MVTSGRKNKQLWLKFVRNDGKLLVAGGETGSVRICDVSSRTILRSFTGHTQYVL